MTRPCAWSGRVNDEQALLLLATLNRLSGEGPPAEACVIGR